MLTSNVDMVASGSDAVQICSQAEICSIVLGCHVPHDQMVQVETIFEGLICDSYVLEQQ